VVQWLGSRYNLVSTNSIKIQICQYDNTKIRVRRTSESWHQIYLSWKDNLQYNIGTMLEFIFLWPGIRCRQHETWHTFHSKCNISHIIYLYCFNESPQMSPILSPHHPTYMFQFILSTYQWLTHLFSQGFPTKTLYLFPIYSMHAIPVCLHTEISRIVFSCAETHVSLHVKSTWLLLLFELNWIWVFWQILVKFPNIKFN
jgi:hypothetical protein